MQEAGGAQGKRCEASVVLPLLQAQAVVTASGKSLDSLWGALQAPHLPHPIAAPGVGRGDENPG